MTIILTQQQLNQIYQHGQEVYPEECCGIILGSIQTEISPFDKIAVELIPTDNVWNRENALDYGENGENSRRQRYAIAPQMMLQAQKTARDRSLHIIGVYHSHPDYPATPSEFDRRYAWPEYSYIIASIYQAQPGDIYSWCLDDNQQFQPEPLTVQTRKNESTHIY